MEKIKKALIFSSILFLAISICGLSASAESKVNINTAGVEQLAQLENVGPKKAALIVKHRENTPFKTIEEITLVKGIGQKTFEKIKDRITVGGKTEKG
jgi:competence protein ComEA